jgi:hypothetical protein
MKGQDHIPSRIETIMFLIKTKDMVALKRHLRVWRIMCGLLI